MRTSSTLVNVLVALCIALAVSASPIAVDTDADALDKRVKVGSRPPKNPHPNPPHLPGKPQPTKPRPLPAPPAAAAMCGHFTSCVQCSATNDKTYRVKDAKGHIQTLKLECGWQQTTTAKGRCLPDVEHAKLTIGRPQCAALAARLDGKGGSDENTTRKIKAAALWASIKDHVITGSATKKVSGRHLASNWIRANGQTGLVTNAATGLGSLPFGLRKTKTLFLDGALGAWNEAHIALTCENAIIASMKANRNSVVAPLKGAHGFSVLGPHGHHLCIEYSGASCYPAGIAATTKPAGALCSTMGSVVD